MVNKATPQKGDIVFLPGWGGVVGRVAETPLMHDERIILEWPKNAAPPSFNNPQLFIDCDKNVIATAVVLDTNQVFERTCKQSWGGTLRTIVSDLEDITV